MVNEENVPRVLSELVVPPSGALKATGNPFEPYRLVDGAGETIGPAAAFFAELVACGRPTTTLRSYGMNLLRWFRFLSALEMVWDQATQVEARDFWRWLQVALKPVLPHWRYSDGGGPGSDATPGADRENPGPGKAPGGDRYAAVTVAHCESMLRGFYDFHLEAGTGHRAGGRCSTRFPWPVPVEAPGRGRIPTRWNRFPGSAAVAIGPKL